MEKMSSIHNIIFDFGGVLINLNKKRCVENFKKLGIDVENIIGIMHNKGIFEDLEKGKISTEEFRNGLRAMTSQKVSDEELDLAWLSILEDIPQYKLDMLLDLRRKHRLYLLSNTNPIHWEYAKKNIFERNGLKLKDYFDECFLSYEIGLTKPDSDIFEYVINEAQIFARETLFIDDSELNTDAARRWCFSVYTAKEREDFSHIFKY
jgi:putative hydrolase of the HAD superfamily